MKISYYFLLYSLFLSTSGLAQVVKSAIHPKITLPTPPAPTIPVDAMFAIGQQSGKIDDMSKRLGSIETDIKNISKDVGSLNIYAKILGMILVLIVAPLVYEGIKRLVFSNASM